jgi:hypothetical protein
VRKLGFVSIIDTNHFSNGAGSKKKKSEEEPVLPGTLDGCDRYDWALDKELAQFMREFVPFLLCIERTEAYVIKIVLA